MSHLERSDIQGIILRGYEEMHAACFVLAHIDKPDNLKYWLKHAQIRNAGIKPISVRSDTCINVAFTRPGLEKLGVARDAFKHVSREFHEGIVGRRDFRTDSEVSLSFDEDEINHRQRMLGDFGSSAPARWRWGNEPYAFDNGEDPEDSERCAPDNGEKSQLESDAQIHVLLMLYAPDDKKLRDLYASLPVVGDVSQRSSTSGVDHAFGFDQKYNRNQPGEADAAMAQQDLKEIGLRVLRVLSTNLLDGRKEHFGYRDGIGQPTVEGEETGSGVDPDNVINAGEFLFGYRNEYERYPLQTELPHNDFVRNGSFLVFRQLAQDVPQFWGFVTETAQERSGSAKKPDLLRTASLMVGRWPSGAPLLLAPDDDRPALENENDFKYSDVDPKGLRCPIGSHIRRTNPRDDFPFAEEKSSRLGRRHRLIRRGRAYGAPIPGLIKAEGYDVDPTLDWSTMKTPADTATNDGDTSKIARGLHFICFNANISRQFEFIQSAWIMNPKFAGLSNDPDPICGEHGEEKPHPTRRAKFRPEWKGGTFTVQSDPANDRIDGLSRYVHVHGAGYFFMPGISALRYLGDH